MGDIVPEATIRALCLKQLNLKADHQIPPIYLEEVKSHIIDFYPHDTSFTISFQRGLGYGVAICRENGCNNIAIPLGSNPKIPDGGKALGFGSLFAYRAHLARHPNHRIAREARLRRTVQHQSSVLNAHNGNGNTTDVHSTISIKQEPGDLGIPRKRTSDNVFLKGASAHLKKKIKRENTNPLLQTESVEDIRLKINDIQQNLSHKQTLLDRVLRANAAKTKAGQTRITNLRGEIRQLRSQKESYDALLPRATSPVKRTSSLVKSEFDSEPLIKSDFATQLASIKAESSKAANRKSEDQKLVTAGTNVSFGADDDEMDVDPSAIVNNFAHLIPQIAPIAGADNRDENGDYHGRGRDMFVGPQAKADDIDKFLVAAGNAELFDGNSTIEDALQKLDLESTHDLIPGLDIALMPHQLLGVSWMVANERKKAVSGGMLADEMGLGKTVQMIATMAKNPSQDQKCKTTLILCPLALLAQWRQEIATKVNANWNVLTYHGSNKPRRKADLLAYDVVLTTYGTMALEWPDLEAEIKKKEKAKSKKPTDIFIVSDSDNDSDVPKTRKKKDRGLLFQVDFYRIVLDEAQNIRNKRTRAGSVILLTAIVIDIPSGVSRAVTDLSSRLRWCLTATPIVNGLLDMYGPIRFLQIRPWYDFSEFNGHIAKHEKKSPQLAVTRLQTVLNLFLLRRMKTSMLDGQKLIELPEKTIDLVSLDFSPEERELYTQECFPICLFHFPDVDRQVETAQQAKFNKFLREGTVLKNYTSVLVLLLRLRQLCSHPALIQENGSHLLAPKRSNFNDVLSRARQEVSAEFVKKMKERYADLALRRIAAEKESTDAVIEVDDCPICFDVLTETVVTACGHEFCHDCIVNFLQTTPPEENSGLKATQRPCPACRSPISSDKLFPVAAFEPTDEDIKDEETSDIEMSPIKPRRRRARKATSRKIVLNSSEEEDTSDDDDLSDFIVQSDGDTDSKDAKQIRPTRNKRRTMVVIDSDSDEELEKEILCGHRQQKRTKAEMKSMPTVLASTKLQNMMEYIKKLALEKPDEKTLVVSQWTSCLKIVSDYLDLNDIGHVKYQGDMTTTQREKAVTVFMSKDKARVLLMSLKCGGVGLNLTRASHVISLDLGWSPAIDNQAFDRVHRLGQQRPVTVRRLVIQNTVEDRILALQERKQNLADGSLGEGKGKKLGRLTVKELANLFGLDSRGRVLAKD
ncbi:SNF2 superfamily protein [Mycena indigotica]|uniref:SNF2 superfamily protein n=1 Tax=Mycena indigotica TaxID=2126181 RepID=A0A8H6S0V4_9AGAR|nr:SNF2 superfamily protein [Mycena indigotica]KAF7289976.1 SNF2 superfamily protein [Mycena indigotica]